MIATTAQGTIKVFSDRFALKGMTGVFPASVEADLAGVSGTAGPPPVNVHIGERQAAAGAAAGVEASFAIPYPLQDGPTKYAPMQPVPGTKITATNTAPLYPTSSVSLASTFLPIPTVVTTVTQSQTFVAASHANTVRCPIFFFSFLSLPLFVSFRNCATPEKHQRRADSLAT